MTILYAPYNMNTQIQFIMGYTNICWWDLPHQLNFFLTNWTFFSPTDFWSRQLHFFLANWTLVSPTALFSRQLNFVLTNCTFFSPSGFVVTKWFFVTNILTNMGVPYLLISYKKSLEFIPTRIIFPVTNRYCFSIVESKYC